MYAGFAYDDGQGRRGFGEFATTHAPCMPNETAHSNKSNNKQYFDNFNIFFELFVLTVFGNLSTFVGHAPSIRLRAFVRW